MTWKNEKIRHSLSSRGISTKNIKRHYIPNQGKNIEKIPVSLPYQKRLDTNPPTRLINLIITNNEGSYGEYEEYIPKAVQEHVETYDSTWMPFLKHNHVIWKQIK